jgi:exosortase A-associated hydrolase 1
VKIARKLCAQGAPVLRFDYEGIGDADGAFVGYEYAAPSIRAAVDAALARLPSAKHVILWALCDGSSVSAFYAPSDKDRIAAMILCNPFVVTEQGKAQTYLKHYYIRRVFQKDFLAKLLRFKFDFREAARSLISLVRSARKTAAPVASTGPAMAEACRVLRESHVAESVIWGMGAYGKPIRFLLSTDDFTAMEFQSLIRGRKETARLLEGKSVTVSYVEGADHTFTESRFKDRVAELTMEAAGGFLETLRAGGKAR